MGLQDFMKDLAKEENKKKQDSFSTEDFLNTPENIIKQNKDIINETPNMEDMMVGDRKAVNAMKGSQITILAPEKFEPEEIGHFEFKRKAENEIENPLADIIKESEIVDQEEIPHQENKKVTKFNIKKNQTPKDNSNTFGDEDILNQIDEIVSKANEKINNNSNKQNNKNEDLINNFLNGNLDLEENLNVVKEDKKAEEKIVVEEKKEIIKEKEIKQEVVKQEIKKSVKIKIEEMPETQKINFLFKQSETPIEKRELWIDYYYKAQKSRKVNPISEKMKQGKFTITMDDQVVIMPDMDIYGMSSDEILKRKWLN